MNVGLTYDLRTDYLAAGYGEEETAEFDRESTIEALEGALVALGHRPVRIGNIHALVAALARGERWDLVVNLCEGLHGFGREAQVPSLLDAHGIAYTFADPLVAAVTLHKPTAKRVLRDAGVPTADFVVVSDLAEVAAAATHLGAFPVFVKPVAEGTAKGVRPTSRVETERALREEVGLLLERYRQPVLVEPFLPGREFTTGILGEGRDARVLGTMEIVLLADRAEAHAYTYLNKEECEERCDFPLADEVSAAACAEVALAAWRALGCRDAGRVDLRADGDGRIQVLEANPIPGMHPEHSDLPMIATRVGMSYVDLVGQIVASAARRRR